MRYFSCSGRGRTALTRPDDVLTAATHIDIDTPMALATLEMSWPLRNDAVTLGEKRRKVRGRL
jgi:hypothetical protein